MELFEFVMVLVSIIVGLGMATLLTGVANLIRARRSVRPYWVHTLIIPLVFLVYAQVWWESWSLSAAAEWSFLGLLMMLGSPILLFLVSHLLFPESLPDADLSEYYFEIAPVVWLLGAGATLIATMFRPIVFGSSLLEVANLASIPTLLICLVLAATRDRWIHGVLVPALLVVVFLDTVLITAILR
jgi:hypothetical protein